MTFESAKRGSGRGISAGSGDPGEASRPFTDPNQVDYYLKRMSQVFSYT